VRAAGLLRVHSLGQYPPGVSLESPVTVPVAQGYTPETPVQRSHAVKTCAGSAWACDGAPPLSPFFPHGGRINRGPGQRPCSLLPLDRLLVLRGETDRRPNSRRTNSPKTGVPPRNEALVRAMAREEARAARVPAMTNEHQEDTDTPRNTARRCATPSLARKRRRLPD
jgi:hypothetical protein